MKPGNPPGVIDPDLYEARGYPHELWTELRRDAPLCRVECEQTQPFWTVTRHEDIAWVSRQPKRFVNAPRLVVNPDNPAAEAAPDVRMLIGMDPPEHGAYRRLASGHFTPRALRRLAPRVEAIAGEVLDQVTGQGELREGDFVAEVAAAVPLAVIAELLGVPRSDWRLLFHWTNEIVGSADPEFQHGSSAAETLERARRELFAYFAAMVEKRRREPRNDIVSVIANARLDGQPLPDLELLSYYFLLVAAGNETTRNAISGGLLALLENPDQLDLLRGEPSLLPKAVEEILRWTSPIIHFCRTAVEDIELRGKRIRSGESLVLFYPSANRDEDVFEAPFRFDIDRTPNPHLAFGIGEHFCLGAHLARLELQSLFGQLIERLDEAEIAGPISRLRSVTVGGIKHMPLRYRLLPRGRAASSSRPGSS
jgi:cytochrome P450